MMGLDDPMMDQYDEEESLVSKIQNSGVKPIKQQKQRKNKTPKRLLHLSSTMGTGNEDEGGNTSTNANYSPRSPSRSPPRVEADEEELEEGELRAATAMIQDGATQARALSDLLQDPTLAPEQDWSDLKKRNAELLLRKKNGRKERKRQNKSDPAKVEEKKRQRDLSSFFKVLKGFREFFPHTDYHFTISNKETRGITIPAAPGLTPTTTPVLDQQSFFSPLDVGDDMGVGQARMSDAERKMRQILISDLVGRKEATSRAAVNPYYSFAASHEAKNLYKDLTNFSTPALKQLIKARQFNDLLESDRQRKKQQQQQQSVFPLPTISEEKEKQPPPPGTESLDLPSNGFADYLQQERQVGRGLLNMPARSSQQWQQQQQMLPTTTRAEQKVSAPIPIPLTRRSAIYGLAGGEESAIPQEYQHQNSLIPLDAGGLIGDSIINANAGSGVGSGGGGLDGDNGGIGGDMDFMGLAPSDLEALINPT